MEKAVVATLYELAGRPNGERLYQLLPMDSGCWEELGGDEQRRIVGGIVEEISYDRRLQQGRIRLREPWAAMASEAIMIRAGKEPLAGQTPPDRRAKIEPTEPVLQPMPRITKLLALAVRFEELLRNGTAKDYADLARLGCVSRSRITQIMNLRSLAPRLQEVILLQTPEPHAPESLNEHSIRKISALADWREQVVKFEQCCEQRGGSATLDA